MGRTWSGVLAVRPSRPAPSAILAKSGLCRPVAKSRKPAAFISSSGDGGLAMLLGDLLTLRQLDLPVKVVVFRNDALAFVDDETT
jgi:thiamine pyrophosphate-dependent acetolactate synthase large subunit-like protein